MHWMVTIIIIINVIKECILNNIGEIHNGFHEANLKVIMIFFETDIVSHRTNYSKEDKTKLLADY